jgi:glycosyltransferase involved in cell wall biosynthesis
MLADRLVARGHSVRWWGSTFLHQHKLMLFKEDQEIPLSQGLTLQLLKGCGYSSNVSLARYLDHRLIAGKFRKKALKLAKPDIIVASTPCYHLAFEAVSYARLRNIPVLVDIRDLWPDAFLTAIKNPLLKKLGRLALYSDFCRLRQLLREADGLLSMSKGILDWALAKAERPEGKWDRVFFLGHQPASETAELPESLDRLAWLKGHETKKLVLYIGTFGVSYELSLVLEAARRLHSCGREDVCFILAGTGEQEALIRRQCNGLPNVLAPGWLDEPQIISLLKICCLGLVPCKSVKDALPNKPFEYLSAGLPLVSSLEGVMEDLINRYGLGLNYRVGDLDGLCQALEILLDNPSLKEKMSDNCRTFFKEYGDAGKIYTEYARHIEHLAGAGKQVINLI